MHMNQARLEGTAYGRAPQAYDPLLTEVSPGTPCGEYLRRYWHPVLASKNVADRPKAVRILGEDLIVFRDGSGRPGLLYPHCMHRGASLFYGKVEDDGIRCCYHGWKFDVEGHCLEQPCEPHLGSHRNVARQPWYPARDHYGMVWAYMGPSEKMPLLPRFEHMEPLGEGEFYYVLDNSVNSHADFSGPEVVPYNWTAINENCLDPFHVQVLHSTFSTVHFLPEMAIMPTVTWEEIGIGVIYKSRRTVGDGEQLHKTLTWVAPNISVNPGPESGKGRKSLSIFVPVDDTHTRAFAVRRAPAGFEGIFKGLGLESTKPWTEMSPQEHQDMPNDYEAQGSQGPNGIPLHSQEHLVTSDIGIALQRRVLRREVQKVLDGKDPLNVFFSANVLRTPSGVTKVPAVAAE
jgi:phenylpropionate dioxygenase-like ring-hydroxylating dioxygenase large terminal subunit